MTATLPAPSRLQDRPSDHKRSGLPVGISGPVVRQRPTGERVIHRLRWGLVPSWAKDETIATRLINARGESVSEKPSFRAAFRRRRCIVPANGFYEWQPLGDRQGGGKQRHPLRRQLQALHAPVPGLRQAA